LFDVIVVVLNIDANGNGNTLGDVAATRATDMARRSSAELAHSAFCTLKIQHAAASTAR
jgi:hypothetical protein